MMARTSPTPSIKGLLSGVTSDVHLLISQTLTILRLELSEGVSVFAWSAAGVLSAALAAVAGAAVLVSAMVLGLIAVGLPAWAAATIVGAVLMAAGAIGARYFISAMLQAEIGLPRTRASVRNTAEWLRRQAGS
jgi:hypothetical protein